MLLGDEVRGDLKDLAVRADNLFQHHRPNVTIDEDLAEAVAALAVCSGKAPFRGKKKDGGGCGSVSSNTSGCWQQLQVLLYL